MNFYRAMHYSAKRDIVTTSQHSLLCLHGGRAGGLQLQGHVHFTGQKNPSKLHFNEWQKLKTIIYD